jgi:DNA modification methylase
LKSLPEGDLILDCFFGVGTTGIVARELERNFIGLKKCTMKYLVMLVELKHTSNVVLWITSN